MRVKCTRCGQTCWGVPKHSVFVFDGRKCYVCRRCQGQSVREPYSLAELIKIVLLGNSKEV